MTDYTVQARNGSPGFQSRKINPLINRLVFFFSSSSFPHHNSPCTNGANKTKMVRGESGRLPSQFKPGIITRVDIS